MRTNGKRPGAKLNIKVLRIKVLSAAIAVAAIFTASLISGMNCVHADEEADRLEIIEQQLNSDSIAEMEEQLEKFSDEEIEKIIPEYRPDKILEDAAKGRLDFNTAGLLARICNFFFRELYQNLGLLIKLMVLVVLCSLLKNLQASFLSDSVGELAFYACYVVIVSVMFVSFKTVLNLGTDIIDKMVAFMHSTVPILITLLVSGGNITSAGIFQPVLIMVVEMSATVIKNVFLPLVIMSAVLSVVDNISEKIQISRFAALLKQITTWGLGFLLTLLVGVITLQGTVGAVVDGVTGKTAKFAIGTFIPIAGKYLADAAEAVLGCTLLIRNSVGIVALLGIVAICIVPLLKILAIVALYKLACALIEPVAEKRITDCINGVAESLTYILGIVASVAVMFLISITVMIGAGNVSTMVR